MENIELKINPKEVLKGGMKLWKIETKERLYNGRWKILTLTIISIILFFFKPFISYSVLGIIFLIFLIDYLLTFLEYKKLANQHRKQQLNTYFLHLNETGFSHTLSEDKKERITNLWASYSYLIDAEEEGILILKDNSGGTNLYFKSWMTEQAFTKFKQLAYKKIGRKLNNRFV